MTSPGPRESRDELLARVLAGEIPADAPEVLAAARADAGFARELRELGALVDSLDQHGASATAGATGSEVGGGEAAGSEIGKPEPWPGADEAMRKLARAKLGVGRSRRDRRWWLAAAAAVAAVAFWCTRDDRLSAPPDLTLGRTLLPNGPTTREELKRDGFRWPDADRPTTLGRFRVTVEAADGTKIDTSPDLGTREQWRPDAAAVDSYPAAFRWVVTLRVADEEQTWQAQVTLSR
jgi:hypothetical protein